jgi:hypothetical protein
MADLTPRLSAIQSQAANLIINGALDISQRIGTTATTVVAAGARTYGADRFPWLNNLSNNTTAQLVADSPTFAQSGYASVYSMKLTNNATPSTPSAAQEHRLNYRVEGYDYQVIHGQPARFQFWVKTSVSGTYSVSFQNSANNRSYVTTYSIAVGEVNTWVKRYFDLTMDSAGTWLFDNSTGLNIQWIQSSGTNFQTSTLNAWQTGDLHAANTQTNWAGTASSTFQIAQVMLVPGDFTSAGASNVDLVFRRAAKTIGEELRMCQRYYEKLFGNIGTGNSNGAGAMAFPALFKVSKRAAPTITMVGTISGNDGTAQPNFSVIGTTPSIDNSLINGSAVFTTFRAVWIQTADSSNYLNVDIEL